jgi:hypothetical protein
MSVRRPTEDSQFVDIEAESREILSMTGMTGIDTVCLVVHMYLICQSAGSAGKEKRHNNQASMST